MAFLSFIQRLFGHSPNGRHPSGKEHWTRMAEVCQGSGKRLIYIKVGESGTVGTCPVCRAGSLHVTMRGNSRIHKTPNSTTNNKARRLYQREYYAKQLRGGG